MAVRPDRFAVIADIHGNKDALQAVLEDMEHHGITQAVNLGDHFSGPLDAKGTAEILLKHDFTTILGNHDRYLITQEADAMGPSDRSAFDQLDPSDLDWLRTLPATQAYGDDVFMCHGTPASDTTYWLEHVADDGTIRMAERAWIEEQAQGVHASLILCAHTHTARSVRLADGRLVVNPGSVGCPAYDDDTPRYHEMQTGMPFACYAILERYSAGWSPTFRQVPYDTTRMAKLAQMQQRTSWANALTTGWVES